MTILQNDRRWGALQLGTGKSTIGRGGCLLCVLTMAVRHLTDRSLLIPPHVNQACIEGDCFTESNLIFDRACRMYGLTSPPAERITLPLMEQSRAPLVDALQKFLRGGLAVIHVDHDSSATNGDPEGDHFLLCVGMDDQSAQCADPALGRTVDLVLPSLTANVEWGRVSKTYRAVSVRPVRLSRN